MEESEYNQILAEKRELELLNSIGQKFTVNKRWTGWLSKNKTREFTITSPCVGVLDRLSYEFIQLDIDEELLSLNPLGEVKIVVRKHARRCAKIVATAVLGNSPLYKFLIWFATGYFYMRVDAKMLMQLTLIINHQANYADFISSIRFLRAATTTKPQLVEEKEAEQED